MERKIESTEELEHEAKELAKRLGPSADKATLVTLSGELGAGKTALTEAVAKALGVEEHLTSPTFVLEKIYALPRTSGGFRRLVHIDAYRLESGMELSALGFDELMSDPENLVFLEWPENVSDALLKPALAITITVSDNTSRTIRYVTA